MQKEDSEFYPFLKKEAENDPELSGTINSFISEMESITIIAMDFFRKYETGGGSLEFAKDFGFLTVALANRIRREESVIYKEYENRKGKISF